MVEDLATDDKEPSPSAAYWLVRQTRERFMSLDYPKPPFPAQQQAINARLVRDRPQMGTKVHIGTFCWLVACCCCIDEVTGASGSQTSVRQDCA